MGSGKALLWRVIEIYYMAPAVAGECDLEGEYVAHFRAVYDGIDSDYVAQDSVDVGRVDYHEWR